MLDMCDISNAAEPGRFAQTLKIFQIRSAQHVSSGGNGKPSYLDEYGRDPSKSFRLTSWVYCRSTQLCAHEVVLIPAIKCPCASVSNWKQMASAEELFHHSGAALPSASTS